MKISKCTIVCGHNLSDCWHGIILLWTSSRSPEYDVMYLVWKYAQFDGLNHPDTVYEIDRKVSCSVQTLQIPHMGEETLRIPQHGPDG